MNNYSWTVLGAGSAGIAAIGKLLDVGVPPRHIAWIDPDFTVGDLKNKWYRVQGNTQISLFIQFLKACKSFNYTGNENHIINTLNEQDTCRLEVVAEPLQSISDNLKKQVNAITGKVEKIFLKQQLWHIKNFDNRIITSEKVIVATGSQPATLNYSLPIIPLEIALNDQLLNNLSNETIAVFGSSHSAIIAIENLVNKAKKIINIYRHPIKYAIKLNDFTLFENTGLKAHAAKWARQYIDGVLPNNLERIHYQDKNIDKKLSECTKVIYAIGFKVASSINIFPYPQPHYYNDINGIIAPGLFGIGIAYPNKVTDPLGNTEYDVGLFKFMLHLNKCLPIWMNYP